MQPACSEASRLRASAYGLLTYASTATQNLTVAQYAAVPRLCSESICVLAVICQALQSESTLNQLFSDYKYFE